MAGGASTTVGSSVEHVADDETADVDGEGLDAVPGGDELGAEPVGTEAEQSRRRAPASRLQPKPEAPRTALSPKVEAWRKRSATGAILTGFAFGLREALEPERKEPAIIMETSGDPPRDLPVEADLEDHRPRRSVVNIRPWLLEAHELGETAGDEPTPDATTMDPDDPAGGDPANN